MGLVTCQGSALNGVLSAESCAHSDLIPEAVLMPGGGGCRREHQLGKIRSFGCKRDAHVSEVPEIRAGGKEKKWSHHLLLFSETSVE